MNLKGLFVLSLSAVMLGACGGGERADDAAPEPSAANEEIAVSDAELEGNPFMEDWRTPYGVPPFSRIENGHYMPAIKKGILEQRADIAAIVENPEPPTFDNTIVALEVAGEMLDRVSSTFGNVTSTDIDDELRSLETKIYPMLTREFNAIMLNGKLFDRIRTLYEQSENLGLDEQDARLLELRHRQFVRQGAALDPETVYFDMLATHLPGGVRCPLHTTARREAGFTESELGRLEALCNKS